LEAVIVATTEDRHLAPVEAALRSGLHVLCEKPIATNLADADAMRDAADGRLVVGHLLRFDPRYLAVRDAVAEGRLGDIVHLFARRTTWDKEGLAVRGRTSLPLYLGVHDLDIFRWLGGEIERVHAEAGGAGVVGHGQPDAVLATVRFKSGAVGLLELSWSTAAAAGIEWDSRLVAYGTRGTASVDIRDTGVSLFAPGGQLFPDTTYWPQVHGVPTGVLVAEAECFLRVVRGQMEWPLTLDDARAALAAALALERSLSTGQPCVVSP
jgi:predicted dehydrogenase